MTSVSEGLAKLSKIFAEQLPGKLSDIVEQIESLADVPWAALRVEPLHRQVHSLTGSAGTFGMPDVSDAARPLELLLVRFLHRSDGPQANELAEIEVALQNLLQVAERLLTDPALREMLPQVPSLVPVYAPLPGAAPLVYIVDDEAMHAQYLAEIVTAADYRVQIFSDLDSFRAVCLRKEWPAAIVMDMGFPEGGNAGAQTIAALRSSCPPELPVIFVSGRDDIGARLAAYRAGASRYLTKPVKEHQLLEQLARLTLRTPNDPYRVLVVDDDPLLIQAMADMLRSAGMVVRTEQAALKTLDALRQFKPDVLLLDVYMPDCNGTELAMVLREQDDYAAMPILFLSVETDFSKQSMTLTLGGDDYLVKPIQRDQLILAVTTRAKRARAIRGTMGGAPLKSALGTDAAGLQAAAASTTSAANPPEVNAALEAAHAAHAAAHSAKARFLSNMSHEMRTPLNAILGYAQLVQIDVDLQGESAQSVREGAQEITKAGQHLLSLINDVLDLAKIEAGRMEVTLGPVWLDELFLACQSVAEPLARPRSVTLEFQYEQTKNVMINADGARIKQVLLSFISNAIKFNKPGGRVVVSWNQPSPFLIHVQVADSGVGMSSEQMEQLYTPFDRLGAEQGNIEGAGIGLSISRQLVELMGGTVGVVSQMGEGSTFWFELPVMQAAELLQSADTLTDQSIIPASSSAEKKVLYIEDSATNVRLMRKIMSKRPDLLVQDVPSAELGLPLAQSFRPDLILLDLNLPGMDGYQALAQLRRIDGLQRTPVIAVTANAMKGDAERGLSAGFAAYVIKPIDIVRFYSLLDYFLADATAV